MLSDLTMAKTEVAQCSSVTCATLSSELNRAGYLANAATYKYPVLGLTFLKT